MKILKRCTTKWWNLWSHYCTAGCKINFWIISILLWNIHPRRMACDPNIINTFITTQNSTSSTFSKRQYRNIFPTTILNLNIVWLIKLRMKNTVGRIRVCYGGGQWSWIKFTFTPMVQEHQKKFQIHCPTLSNGPHRHYSQIPFPLYFSTISLLDAIVLSMIETELFLICKVNAR